MEKEKTELYFWQIKWASFEWLCMAVVEDETHSMSSEATCQSLGLITDLRKCYLLSTQNSLWALTW